MDGLFRIADGDVGCGLCLRGERAVVLFQPAARMLPQVLADVQPCSLGDLDLTPAAIDGIAGADQHGPRPCRIARRHDPQAADYAVVVQHVGVTVQPPLSVFLLGAEIDGRQEGANEVFRSWHRVWWI